MPTDLGPGTGVAPPKGATSAQGSADAGPNSPIPPRSEREPEKDDKTRTDGPPTPTTGHDKKHMSFRTKALLVVGAVIVVLAATVYYLYARQYEDTDDAEIDGNLHSISTRVPGTVLSVEVEDNQTVSQGDLLLELDPADLDVSIAQAQAQVAQAQAELEAEHPNVPITVTTNQASTSTASSDLQSSLASAAAAHADVEQLRAQLVQAEANARTASVERDRTVKLFEAGATTESDFDDRSDTATAAEANVQAARHSLAAAEARERESAAKVEQSRIRLTEVRENSPRQVGVRRADVAARVQSLDLARALLRQAELNRSYANIRAPVSGIIGKKTVNAGDRVSPGQELMALSDTVHVWVTANFRETQLERIRPGQTATIHVDALGQDFRGEVESVGGATGSRYSVLPPENATGNYVKVVQRIPVRVRFDPNQPGLDRLRLGMSVEPKVKVR
jgi:membrane fusion protein, multidrug efflux system